jgi:hypothetical protein
LKKADVIARANAIAQAVPGVRRVQSRLIGAGMLEFYWAVVVSLHRGRGGHSIGLGVVDCWFFQGGSMDKRKWGKWLVLCAWSLLPALAQAQALSGVVSSAEEGNMEGVLVNARRAGSNMTVTVVTDDRGPARAHKLPGARAPPRPGALPVSGGQGRARQIHVVDTCCGL